MFIKGFLNIFNFSYLSSNFIFDVSFKIFLKLISIILGVACQNFLFNINSSSKYLGYKSFNSFYINFLYCIGNKYPL